MNPGLPVPHILLQEEHDVPYSGPVTVWSGFPVFPLEHKPELIHEHEAVKTPMTNCFLVTQLNKELSDVWLCSICMMLWETTGLYHIPKVYDDFSKTAWF